MQALIGVYAITIPPEADSDGFEQAMKSEVFPSVKVGQATRGGTVTAQFLLKGEAPSDNEYSWVVHWENMGGSPFGAANSPADPAPKLKAFGAKTSFARSVLVAGEAISRVP